MSKSLSEAARRAGRVRGAVVLAFLACLFAAGCTQRDGSSDKDPPGGFYGGLSGGMGM